MLLSSDSTTVEAAVISVAETGEAVAAATPATDAITGEAVEAAAPVTDAVTGEAVAVVISEIIVTDKLYLTVYS